MDPHGPIARRFPLVARFRPACLPLPDRVQSLADLADRAVAQHDQGLASAVFNQSALLASDLGLPNLARTMCHRHANTYLQACPLPAASAIRGLEPLVNLARLQIRAGHNDDGRRRLLDLYEAVGVGNAAAFEGITVPANLTPTAEDRHEVRAWLWRVLLADGTRALTTTGRWREALAHIEEHRGIGTRMLDGRQVAVVTALTEGDTDHAFGLLADTTPGELWEQAVTHALTALCLPAAGRTADTCLGQLADICLSQPTEPGMTVFDTRLRLTALEALAPAKHPTAYAVVDDLARRTNEAQNGYTARELLASEVFIALANDAQVQDCRELVRTCGLRTGVLPQEHSAALSACLDSSELVITRCLSTSAATSP